MERTDIRYQTYVDILKRELVPAMGCTEPIALAYCAAKERKPPVQQKLRRQWMRETDKEILCIMTCVD